MSKGAPASIGRLISSSAVISVDPVVTMVILRGTPCARSFKDRGVVGNHIRVVAYLTPNSKSIVS